MNASGEDGWNHVCLVSALATLHIAQLWVLQTTRRMGPGRGPLAKAAVYRLQFLGHRVEPYAALATG